MPPPILTYSLYNQRVLDNVLKKLSKSVQKTLNSRIFDFMAVHTLSVVLTSVHCDGQFIIVILFFYCFHWDSGHYSLTVLIC